MSSFSNRLVAELQLASCNAEALSSLEGKWEEAVAAWPGLSPDEGRFARRLGELCRQSDAGDLAACEALHWNDLLLATECLAGVARAVSHLDAGFGAGVEQVARRLPGLDVPADQFRRELWAELLEPRAGRAPRLAGYSGSGSLAAWLRVIAVRRARASLARAHTEPARTDDGELGVDPDDPELSYLKALYRDEFKRAFNDAAEALSARERNLLRHSIIDGLSIDQIGRIYHVHRATAARQLDRARTRLRSETRRLLMQRLGVQPSMLRSLSRLVASQLDVSVRRVLARRPH